MGAVLTRLLEVFWTKKLDIVVIGLENRYVVCVRACVRLFVCRHTLVENEVTVSNQCYATKKLSKKISSVD